MAKMSKETKQRLQQLFQCGQFVIRWGFIPTVLYLVMLYSTCLRSYLADTKLKELPHSSVVTSKTAHCFPAAYFPTSIGGISVVSTTKVLNEAQIQECLNQRF